MDENTARGLVCLNTYFYGKAAASFGSTRHNRWPGWERLLEVPGVAAALRGGTDGALGQDRGTTDDVRKRHSSAAEALQEETLGTKAVVVTDFACGNLRFETFLERAFPSAAFSFQAVDNTSFPLWEQGISPVHFVAADLLDSPRFSLEPASLAVSFGFLHHVPGQAKRASVLQMLLDQVAPGGFGAASFWRFLDEPSLAKRVVAPLVVDQALADAGQGLRHENAQLDPGDAFLGWDNQPGLVRYCHSFSDEDLDDLIARLAAARPWVQLVDRYRADGRSGALNEYLVWRRLP